MPRSLSALSLRSPRRPALLAGAGLSFVLLAAGCDGSVTTPSDAPPEYATVCGTWGPKGIDVSHWQGGVNWGAVAASGIRFGIAAVGDGYYRDPEFSTNWDDMKAHGLIRGAYQFFEPGEDAATQAHILLSMMGSFGAGDLPPTLDVEVSGGRSPGEICSGIHTWFDVIKGATGRTPIIYTGAWFWDPNVQCGDFSGDPLWVSEYGPSCPNLPSAWSHYKIWQYSSSGSVSGVGGGVDVDVFNGSLDELKALAGEGGSSGGGGVDVSHGGGSFAGVALNRDGRLEISVVGNDHQVYDNWQVTTGGWSGFFPMGGDVGSGPADATNSDGRLEAFVVGSDRVMYHKWQKSAGGDWTGWAGLGGQFSSAPSVAVNADGRLEVFGVGTDDQMWHAWQNCAGCGWSGWAPMGGKFTSSPGVARNQDGRLEVFGRGTDNHIWHSWQTCAGCGWSGWADLGGDWTSAPAAATNQDGRLEIFARGTDHQLYHAWQNSAGGAWGAWFSLGGDLTSAPAAGRNADGRIEVFARGTDNQVWHLWQKVANGGWSGWDSLGGSVLAF